MGPITTILPYMASPSSFPPHIDVDLEERELTPTHSSLVESSVEAARQLHGRPRHDDNAHLGFPKIGQKLKRPKWLIEENHRIRHRSLVSSMVYQVRQLA